MQMVQLQCLNSEDNGLQASLKLMRAAVSEINLLFTRHGLPFFLVDPSQRFRMT
jgi:hypothetical protein